MGSGRKHHIGDLGPHCPKCNGIGFLKPTQVSGEGMPNYGAVPAMPGPGGPYPPQTVVPPAGPLPTYIPPSA